MYQIFKNRNFFLFLIFNQKNHTHKTKFIITTCFLSKNKIEFLKERRGIL